MDQASPPESSVAVEGRLQRFADGKFIKGSLVLTFRASSLTNWTGIRDVTVRHATDRFERPVQLFTWRNRSTNSWWPLPLDLTRVHASPQPGWQATKMIWLRDLPNDPQLGRIAGTVEVFCPTPANGGLIELTNLSSWCGQRRQFRIGNDRVAEVTFEGWANYADLDRPCHSSSLPPAFETARDQSEPGQTDRHICFNGATGSETNALVFAISNPDHHLLQIEVLDLSGEPVLPTGMIFGPARLILGFRSLPATNGNLRVYLATPSALRRQDFVAVVNEARTP